MSFFRDRQQGTQAIMNQTTLKGQGSCKTTAPADIFCIALEALWSHLTYLTPRPVKTPPLIAGKVSGERECNCYFNTLKVNFYSCSPTTLIM